MGALTIRRWTIALLLAVAPALAPAQTDTVDAEVRIKAAFLYKFGGFVEWPPEAFSSADRVFVIGVVGADALAEELERVVAGRTIRDLPVLVKRLRRGEAPGRLHMLFVGRAENSRLPEVLAAVLEQPVLVVTESENAISRGSMINFVRADERVRFDVALPSAERGKLKVSARLLTVARRVIQGPS